jgi:hypothetical protein
MRLLFVHGRSQEGKTSAGLEQEWLKPLRRGLGGAGLDLPTLAGIDVPFYGDKLKEFLDRRDLPPADAIETRGGAIGGDYEDFLREVALEAREKEVVTHAEVEQELGPAAQTKGPQNWEWVQAVIRAIDRNTPVISNAGIGVLLRDVFVYVNDGPVRRAINKIVAEKLTEEPTIVVGHSLGTVVAYEVLREHARNNVPRYISVGSPLGIRAIRRRLKSPLTMPDGVKDWYNAFDERDVVALYALDGNNFPLTPAINNYGKVNNHTDNRHGIDGYLDDKDVAKAIRSAIS